MSNRVHFLASDAGDASLLLPQIRGIVISANILEISRKPLSILFFQKHLMGDK